MRRFQVWNAAAFAGRLSYHSIVLASPCSKDVRAVKPNNSDAHEVSSRRRGCPSGRPVCHLTSPSKPVSFATNSTRSLIANSQPLSRLTDHSYYNTARSELSPQRSLRHTKIHLRFCYGIKDFGAAESWVPCLAKDHARRNAHQARLAGKPLHGKSRRATRLGICARLCRGNVDDAGRR